MKALITGLSGQDGAILAKLLLDKGYKVAGTVRRVSSPTNLWRLADLNLLSRIELVSADMTDMASLLTAIHLTKPDEIYNLAAQSFVHASFLMPHTTAQVDAIGVLNLLEAVRVTKPDAKVYQASSSEIWGNSSLDSHNENSPTKPASPYALAKLYGFHAARLYREAYGLYIVNGILNNHESPWRGLEFVTRKVTNYVGRLVTGQSNGPLCLGNIHAIRDFGSAEEYMEAAHLMVQQDNAEDYVISTGVGHSIRELADIAFSYAGADWKAHVEIAETEMRPLDVNRLVGDSSKARQRLGWTPRTTFYDIVKRMVDRDTERWARHKRGESFPWDVIQ